MTSVVNFVRGAGTAKRSSQLRPRLVASFTTLLLGAGVLKGCSFLGTNGSIADEQQTSETDAGDMNEQERITSAIVASDDTRRV